MNHSPFISEKTPTPSDSPIPSQDDSIKIKGVSSLFQSKTPGIVAQASSLGITVIAGLVVGLGVDRFFGWTPWGMLVGMFVGFFSAFMRIVNASKN